MTQDPSHELPQRPSRARFDLGSDTAPDTANDYRPLNWNRGFTVADAEAASTHDANTAPPPGSLPRRRFGSAQPENAPDVDDAPPPLQEDPRLRRPADSGETSARSAARKQASEVMSGRQAIATGLLVLGIVAIVAVAVYVLGGIQLG